MIRTTAEVRVAEESHRDSEEHYRLLFNTIPHAAWVYDVETLRFLAVNEAAVHQYGYSREEFLSMSLENIHPSDDFKTIRQKLAQSALSSVPCRHLKKDGTVVYCDSISRRLLFEGREARVVLAVDMTETRKAEFLYYMLVDSIPMSVLLIDQGLRVALANRNFLEKSRRSKTDTLGKPLSEVFPPVILEELGMLAQIRVAFEKGEPLHGRRLTYRAPGVPLRTYYCAIIPITWAGLVEHVMLLMNDVTEQLRLGEEVRRVERHLASVVESADEIVLSTDTKGRISSWNSAAERMSGYTLGEIQDHFLFDYCAPGQREELRAYFRDPAQQSSSRTAEYEFITSRGAVIPVSWVFSPMKDDAGRTVGTVAVGRNLTEQRKLEQQIRQAEKLAALGVMAGGIAHEVRTPLTIASSAAQFLMEDDITPDFRKECAAKVHLGMHRASAIIENLLHFARPSSNMEMVAVDLPAVIREAITLIANQARLQKIQISCNFPKCPPFVIGNANSLEQVFLNLFVNALNAMPDGGYLAISVEQADGTVITRVSDTGYGISPRDIDRIFDPFFTNAAPGKGTGLGLSICYSILKRHQGSITVDSLPDGGTTFVVRLPAGMPV